MKAYLHFGGAFTHNPNGPFLTVEVEVKESPLYHHIHGLSFTASGYGSKIPTVWKVKHEKRWRRVYMCLYSNSGTAYIISNGKPVATVDIYTEVQK